MSAKLLRIQAERFLSYSRLDLEIPEGLVVLVGPNGAGKSSLVDAIAFALTGTPVSRKVASKADLIRKGSSIASVSLEFEVNNKRYLVSRKLGKTGTSETSLRENDKLKARGATDVNKEIARSLGFEDLDVLREVVFVPQGKLTEILELTPTNLKNKALELLGLKDKDKIDERLRNLIKYIQREVKELERLNNKEKELKKEIERTRKELETLEKELPVLKKKREELLKTIEILSKELEVLNSLKVKYETLKSEFMRLQEELKRIDEELSNINVSEEDYNNIKSSYESMVKVVPLELERKRKELELVLKKKELLKLKESLERELATLSGIENKKYEIENEILMVSKEESELQKELGILETTIKNMDMKLKDLMKKERMISRLIGDSDVDEFRERYIELQMLLERKKKELEDIKEKIRELLAERNEKRKALEMLKGKDKCPVCGAPLPPTKRKYLEEKYKEEITIIESKLIELKEKVVSLERETEELEKELEKTRRALERVEAILEEAGFDDVDALRYEIAQQEKELNAIKDELGEKVSRLKFLSRRYEKLEKERRRLDDLIKRKAEAEGKLSQVTQEIEKMRDVDVTKEDELRSAIDELENKMKEIRRLEETLKEYEKVLKIKKELEHKKMALSERLKAIEHELGGLKYDADEHAEKQRSFEEANSELKGIEKGIVAHETRIAELKKSLREKMEELNELRAEIKKLEDLDLFVKFLEEFRKSFKSKIVNAVIDAFREEWENVTNDILKTFDLEISMIRIVADAGRRGGWYVKAVSPSGEELDTNVLSGGERVGVALALKLALTRVVSKDKVSFMILDEPTVYLDSERRQALKRILMNAVGPTLRQIIVVTHDQEMIDVADVTCDVQKGSDGSRVVCSQHPSP